jgi:hypothetical protein
MFEKIEVENDLVYFNMTVGYKNFTNGHALMYYEEVLKDLPDKFMVNL